MFSIQITRSEELTEIDQLVDQIHSLVDRLVSQATNGERESVEEIELIRDDRGIVIRGDISTPANDRGVLIDLPFDDQRPRRIVA